MSVPVFPDLSLSEQVDGFVPSRDGVRLYWRLFTPRRPAERPATVVVVHGGGDHSGRYPALASALVSAGYTAALVDLRGHGRSGGVRWHVDHFFRYLDDVDAFVEMIEGQPRAGDLFIVAHSAGGLVATLWATVRRRPVAGFVLSSPFFALAKKPSSAKRLGARLLGTITPRLHMSAGIKISELTSDEEMQRWTAADPLYLRATTPRWYVEASRAQREALLRAHEFESPLLLLAGGADTIADSSASGAFFEAAGSTDKKREMYEGLRHELFNEVDRARPIGAAIAWITARAGVGQESR